MTAQFLPFFHLIFNSFDLETRLHNIACSKIVGFIIYMPHMYKVINGKNGSYNLKKRLSNNTVFYIWAKFPFVLRKMKLSW